MYLFCHQTFISEKWEVVSCDNQVHFIKNMSFKSSALVIELFGRKVLSQNQAIYHFFNNSCIKS